MTRFGQVFSDTIEEMTEEMTGPPAGLAGVAMARGRRLRQRRRLAAGGGALLVCAVLALPWLVLSPAADEPQPGSPAGVTETGPPSDTGLAGGWVIVGNGSRVLDRSTGKLVAMTGSILPAPAGGRVLIEEPGGGLRITDVNGSQPVAVDPTDLGGAYQWSPTGERLVGRISQKEPFRIGFAVIDARTGAVTKRWIDHSAYGCSRCSFSWTRDGREIVMAVADRSGGEAAELVSRLQLFDAATGAPTRSLAVTAMPSGPFSWSPDGRYVIADVDVLVGRWQIVELATGQARPFPYDAVWATGDRLLATADGELLTLSPDGAVLSTVRINPSGVRDVITVGPPA
ncbi:TolB family protein [Catellatospora chokoriensis]|uniref:WD40 repeat protein n=1 Tax=Catellatospora chokoriensis TaxID=310353 RepID=A0A8J3K3Y6_9ACTN|nr:hypothetical protein [Catellatospora chokoriensis]GIF93629.1 hypothetical protein Cch02nite_70730 [Catellatospora chokoriensis]